MTVESRDDEGTSRGSELLGTHQTVISAIASITSIKFIFSGRHHRGHRRQAMVAPRDLNMHVVTLRADFKRRMRHHYDGVETSKEHRVSPRQR